MSISVIRKTQLVYLFVSLFTLLFSLIYEVFSHGVLSYYMLFAFLIPLCGGGILFLCPKEDTKYLNLYHCVFSAFTIYSIMKGFLEIYGTTNPLLHCYLFVGVVLTFLTIFQYIKIRVKS